MNKNNLLDLILMSLFVGAIFVACGTVGANYNTLKVVEVSHGE